MKSVRIRSLSGPHFPTLGPNKGEILRISPYSVRMRENTEQKNFKYEYFSRGELVLIRANIFWKSFRFSYCDQTTGL